MLQNVRLITFDIVGTILRFREPPVAKYVEIASEHGIKTDFTLLQKSFYRNWKLMDEKHPHFGSTTKISSMNWWITLVQETFKDVLQENYNEKEIRLVANKLYGYYHSPKPYIVLEDSIKALNQLKSDHKYIEIGAISNFDNRLHDVVPSLGLKQYFDFIVTSEDAKSSKPEAAIFDYAAARCTKSGQLLASEILHVGDDMDKDYFGARNIGWHGLLVDRHGGGYTIVEDNHIVHNMMEIFNKDLEQ
eukprot:TRINITY_DN17775_c0_g1_i6.p1 TRINITY_DN17775_c0_g1~~TRINITY_DN17775_c0_g1_i6.p1  ORF type:complete len:247 (+),score=27.19 TRINITY_DN17775_c0_g1_i6:35-775(+)